VRIFGNEYGIRGEADPEYIEKVAQYVDARMREVSERMEIASHSRVAVLAAVNIADELLRSREPSPSEEESERINRLISLLEEATKPGWEEV